MSKIVETGRALRRLGSEAFAYCLAALPELSHRKRVLIFAQGRSGSTLLESLLQSTGHFVCKGELLGQEQSKIYFPIAYLRGQSRRRADKCFMCHVKIYHLTRDRQQVGLHPVDPRAFLHDLIGDGWSIIYLRRSDRVRHALSNIVAETRERYHKLDDRPETITVHVSRERLEILVAQRFAFERQEREALAGFEHHEIVYERDLENASMHQQTVNGALGFLGLPYCRASTPLRKINTRPLREIVANYDEFAGWVREMGLKDSLLETR